MGINFYPAYMQTPKNPTETTPAASATPKTETAATPVSAAPAATTPPKKSNTLKIVLIVLGVLLLLCIIGGAITAYVLSKTAQQSLTQVQSSATQMEMEAELESINVQVVDYYNTNGKYPDSLAAASITDTVQGTKVSYQVSGDTYTLSLKLPDGSTYTLP